jgi:hypothetical protein
MGLAKMSCWLCDRPAFEGWYGSDDIVMSPAQRQRERLFPGQWFTTAFLLNPGALKTIEKTRIDITPWLGTRIGPSQSAPTE